MTKTTPRKPPTEPPPKPETQRELSTRLVSENPRFRIAKPTGKAFIIVGASPSVRRSHTGITLNEHYDGDGATIYKHACRFGCEGIVSKRLGYPYRSGRVNHWLKIKNPAAPGGGKRRTVTASPAEIQTHPQRGRAPQGIRRARWLCSCELPDAHGRRCCIRLFAPGDLAPKFRPL
jgi:hypothetical protein